MALKQIPIPVKVDLLEDGRRIEVTWQDGQVTPFAAFDLRAECPCAQCVDEMTGIRTLNRDDVNPEVGATSHGRVGRYALQFQWSDGHSTGIYTYERLRGREPENS
jgi:DUF971 family protein